MITPSLKEIIERADIVFKDNPKLARTFKNAFLSTIETTVKQTAEGDVFVITGDIPAMWLRDSSAQVCHYLPFVKEDAELREIIEKLIARQAKCILLDPYANAFNETANDAHCCADDETDMHKQVWERKYEVDSLCYPIRLCYTYWKASGSNAIFTEDVHKAFKAVVDTFVTEQNHYANSTYRFKRSEKVCPPGTIERETLQNNGLGFPVNYTGMTWSGFRPSDDACRFNYLIPSNMFAVVILGYIMEIAREVYNDEDLYDAARKLRAEIDLGIRAYGIYRHPQFGPIYAYETDGFGNYNLMDDANCPGLLSIPYLGYVSEDDEIYRNTRRFVLSKENPYFFEGAFAKGIGSPHTPDNYIWHMSLSMQGLTASTREEAESLIDTLLNTDAGCELMHEGFDVNNPENFTRPWFAWSNSLFAELVYKTYLA